MPKIFLIKNRLHQQQLRLLESQNLIQAKNEDRLNIGGDHGQHDDREPLSLVARKRTNSTDTLPASDDRSRNLDSGEYSLLDSHANFDLIRATFAQSPPPPPPLRDWQLFLKLICMKFVFISRCDCRLRLLCLTDILVSLDLRKSCCMCVFVCCNL